MFAAKVKSYAKINLSLNIAGTSGGYHLLDSVVTGIDVCDTVCAKPRGDKLINVYMHGMGSEGIPPEKNNAVRAGEAFVRTFGTGGADIEIYKDIPMGAGLGGSSADAAGVLNALAKLYKIKDRTKLKEIADAHGSDTGYLLNGGFARLSGRGERVELLPAPFTLHFLLFLPRSSVSTAECFAAYDAFPDPLRAESARMARAVREGNFAEIAQNVYNALQAPACRLNAETAQALEAARSFSPAAAAVTGSGSAVFALFESEELCRWAKSRYKGKLKTRIAKSVVPTSSRKGLRNPFVLGEGEGK